MTDGYIARIATSTRVVPAGVVAVGLAAVALVWLSFAGETTRERERIRQDALVRLDNAARTMESHIGRTLAGVNGTALFLRHVWVHDRDRFAEAVDSVQRDGIPGPSVAVTVMDAEGWARFSTLAPVEPPVNFADRPHVRFHMEGDDDILYVSVPVMGRFAKRTMIQMTRRIEAPHGGYGGTVVLAISPAELVRDVPHIGLGPNGAVAVAGLDRVVRARAPEEQGGQTVVGRTLPADRPFFTQEVGTFEAVGSVDGQTRLFAYRRIPHYPLVVVASETVADLHAATDRVIRPRLVHLSIMSAAILVFALTVAALTAILARLHRQLHDVRRRSDLILEAVGEGICGVDVAGKVVFANQAARRMLGWGDGEGVGLDLHELSHHHHGDGREYPEAECPIRLTATDGTARSIGGEVYWRRDGGSFPVEYTCTPIVEHGEVIGVVNVFRDVTDQQHSAEAVRAAMEDLSRSNAELAEFAYVASHDLREPLRMISSYLALIAKRLGGNADPDLAEFLGFAVDGAKRMDALIIDLLDYSRIGRGDAPHQPVALEMALAEALRDLDVAIADAGATVAVPADDPVVAGNPNELRRLFQNLIGNAVKYRHPDRPPRIRVEWRRQARAWLVVVTDNGIGIPADQRERVFGIFQRLAGRTTCEGTGIGLAVCRKVVERHGGRIWIEDAEGGGCRFCFTLPAE
ncbi:ATP-binding protein [Magnetospirillum sp. UT-4]|uniref:ATP-binding protein n=1 Tax=Magnetospirillum sp. UT-4 TaxID=2681467 RepID=UPI00137C5406|nr:ATP-binding protein [Magnetospirillum sp. UT-4]CAA7619713.1 putative Signal transduction histidine kinase [Magnetospirillum sp. UT-4]